MDDSVLIASDLDVFQEQPILRSFVQTKDLEIYPLEGSEFLAFSFEVMNDTCEKVLGGPTLIMYSLKFRDMKVSFMTLSHLCSSQSFL